MRPTALVLLLTLAGCEGLLSAPSDELGLTCATLHGAERDDGSIVLDHDLRFASADDARALLEALSSSAAGDGRQQLVLGVDVSVDTTLPVPLRQDVTYCVDPDFGAARDAVVRAAQRATEIWSSAIDVRFRYVDTERCAERGVDAHLVFARSCLRSDTVALGMLPYRTQREGQEIELNACHFEYDAYVSSDDALARIFLHELGHVLGFLHAWNTADYDGPCACASSVQLRTLSRYDSDSIMNYPSCGASWTLFDPPSLSEIDRRDAQRVYCAPGEGPPPCGPADS